MKYFEVSFDNFAGDCISCDVVIDESDFIFQNKNNNEIDLIFQLYFLKYRKDDVFIALIPIVVDDTFDTFNTVSFYEFFYNPRSWY